MEKIVSFKCVPERLLLNGDEYKIYGCSVNSFEYPEVAINKYNNATIKGNMQELNLGIEYVVTAKETADKYGTSYDVVNIKREKPTTVTATRNFLYEILTVSQTETLLETYPDIVDRVMNNRLDDIDLSKTKGIKEYTFNVIKNKIIENFKLAEMVEEFRGIFSLSVIKKLYEKYPSIERIREKLRTEPYECLCRLNGIGFKTADAMLLDLEKEAKESIANGRKPILHFGFELRPSYQRAKACIDYLLSENETSGNTYLKVSDMKNTFETLVPEAFGNLAVVLKADNDIIFDKQRLTICKKETYETEQYIAQKIQEGLRQNIEWNYDCEKFKVLDGFALTDKQSKVMETICKKNVVLLVGNAGSGKSSSTQALINMLKTNKKTFKMFAPTGKAAKVLAGYTGEPTSTIHRGLGYMPPSTWMFNAETPLDVDVVIVDEFSMVDIFLMKHLLEAIDFKKTKLLMIGDDAQIPSVGAGNILYDLIQSNSIPMILLDKVFRYGEGGLSTVATDTRLSKQYLDKTKQGLQVFGSDKSYMFMALDQSKILDYTVKLYQGLLDKDNKIEDIGVLTCYNVGDYGTVALNKKLQEAMNPNPEAKMIFGSQEFRLGDIVMCVMNDYKAIVYQKDGSIDEDETTFVANGDSGRIIKILPRGIVIDYGDEKVYCPKSGLTKIKLAYAISIHKSQGDSFKNVIVLSPRSHTFMLNSNLLYVGITRAKQNCYHLGEIRTVNNALKKKENFNRRTLLQSFMKQKEVV